MRDPIHPGDGPRGIDPLGMKAAELARQIEVPVEHMTEILHDGRAITGDAALCLKAFLGTSGEFWVNPRLLYELRLVEQKHRATITGLWTLLAGKHLWCNGLICARTVKPWKRAFRK